MPIGIKKKAFEASPFVVEFIYKLSLKKFFCCADTWFYNLVIF